MAHWAEIDENNTVLRVIVTDNNASNEGYDWLIERLGGNWIQTSFNSNFRNKFAAVGDIYNQQRDVFIPPKPFDSWVLNEDTCLWDPPVSYPNDGNAYSWNEGSQSWDLFS